MALLFTVLLTAAALIMGYFLIDFGRKDFLRESEAAIDTEINMITSLEKMPVHTLSDYITERSSKDTAARFRFEDEQGRLIAGTIDPMPKDITTIAEGVIGFTTNDTKAKNNFAAKIYTFSDGRRIIVARDIQDLTASYERLKGLTWLIMFLMLCVIIVSFAISHFVVSRINRIALTAQNIIHTGDLSQRMQVDSRWDDLSSLSDVLNAFLDKIESLMYGIRAVSNNIAHDLRTPLTSLRNDIEALKNKPVTPQHIDHLLGDADRLLSVFQALLRITNIEKSKRSSFLKNVDLGLVLQDVKELYEPVAEEKTIHIHCDITPNLHIRGDIDLLFQMFANILDNAIKFSPAHSTLRINATKQAGLIVVTIEDQGPGIPTHEKEQVFKHFYRGDNSRNIPGNGLGLSLVKAIAEQHQALISLEDSLPGLRVGITFQPYQ